MKITPKDQENYITNKTNVYNLDGCWSLDVLDSKNYGPENNRRCRYLLVVIDNFIKFGWTFPLKNKNAQTIKMSSEKIFLTSKKPDLFEADRGKKNLQTNSLLIS